jgi:hypothetical protein
MIATWFGLGILLGAFGGWLAGMTMGLRARRVRRVPLLGRTGARPPARG